MIVREVSHEFTDPSVDNQIIDLNAPRPDRLTPTTIATTGSDAARADTNGHSPLSSAVRANATKMNPKPAPAAAASTNVENGVSWWRTPIAPLTSATARQATTIPTSAVPLGRSPISKPTTTGTTALTIAVTGATMVIAPLDRAR